MKKLYPFLFLLLFIAGKSYSQWNYGSPFSTSSEQSTWQHVVNPIVTTGNYVMDSLSGAFPTNAWFNQFYLYGNSWPYIPGPQGLLGENSVFTNPYQIRLGTQLGSNYPNKYAYLAVNYRPFGTTQQGTAQFPKFVYDDGLYFAMGTPDNTANYKPAVLNDYTEISATIKFTNTTNTNQYYYSPLVRGMPYITMIYNNVTPAVYFPSPIVHWVNDTELLTPGQQFTGTVFKLRTLNGDPGLYRSQTWMLYSSTPITLTYNQQPYNGATQDGLVATAPLTGYIRMAHVTYTGEPQAADSTARINLLNAFSKFIPVKGNVQVNVANSSSTTATMNYAYTRYNEASFGSNDSLLMMALPHHVDMLPAGSTTQLMKYQVMKGIMSEVKKKTWVMTENLPQYTWNPQQGTLTNVPLNWCDSIQKYAISDSVYFLPSNQWTDVYSAGKTLAKQGRVITICDELYDRDNSRYAAMQTLAANYRTKLASNLGRWLNGNSSANNPAPNVRDSIMYDTKFKGLISSMSYDKLPSGGQDDFGSALYNDHHFHYGYYLYAAAVIARKNSAFLTANGNYYLNRITDLAREIANPSRTDQHFALQRYKDWYDGNSWANGMVPYGGGKNQESTSEACNAWYGLYLLGVATGNDNMKYQGAVMLQQEIRAAQKYNHIKNTNPTYPAAYSDVYKTITNLYQGVIDSKTFFGDKNYYSNGIQIVPVTPVTEKLWGDITFCQTMYDFSPNGWKFTQCFQPGNADPDAKRWATIGIGVQAMAYPQTALDFWPNYGYANANFDNGQSQSNALHWIVTRKYNTLGIGVTPLSSEIPNNFNLRQNYPNPFNPTTKIVYDLPFNSKVTLRIFDALGKEVSVIVNNETQSAGSYAAEFNAANLSSGIYFYSIIAEGGSKSFAKTLKMVLVK
ncbi:MAG: T9SS type A sorting domain-containing protein [Ignavibacteria bacterium]|nr:T9SS type A sorting domain-containing protein [Ignavibacteria bacterium]